MNTNSVVIDKRLEGTRLDACLSQVSGLTRSRCSHLIEGGHVLLDGCPSKNKTRVKEGQQLVWEVPEPSQLSLAPENIPIEILYQDEDIAVVNKPRGWWYTQHRDTRTVRWSMRSCISLIIFLVSMARYVRVLYIGWIRTLLALY